MKKLNLKFILLLSSFVLAVCVIVGGSIAFLVDDTSSVINTFTPTQVNTYVEETITNGVKTDVRIQNTGSTDAYIRAAVIVTWKNEAGKVYGQLPVEGEGKDYVIDWAFDDMSDPTGWVLGSDGYYYFLNPVVSSALTDSLIKKAEALTKSFLGSDGETYYLSIEIIASAIQADGVDSDDKHPVVLACNAVTGVNNGILVVKQSN